MQLKQHHDASVGLVSLFCLVGWRARSTRGARVSLALSDVRRIYVPGSSCFQNKKSVPLLAGLGRNAGLQLRVQAVSLSRRRPESILGPVPVLALR